MADYYLTKSLRIVEEIKDVPRAREVVNRLARVKRAKRRELRSHISIVLRMVEKGLIIENGGSLNL